MVVKRVESRVVVIVVILVVVRVGIAVMVLVRVRPAARELSPATTELIFEGAGANTAVVIVVTLVAVDPGDTRPAAKEFIPAATELSWEETIGCTIVVAEGTAPRIDDTTLVKVLKSPPPTLLGADKTVRVVGTPETTAATVDTAPGTLIKPLVIVVVTYTVVIAGVVDDWVASGMVIVVDCIVVTVLPGIVLPTMQYVSESFRQNMRRAMQLGVRGLLQYDL